jgi:transcriptional activator of cad operon
VKTTACAAEFRVGAWRVDREACALHGPDGEQRVEPKVMDLLCLLAEHPGRVLSRERIMAALWPGLVVGDDALARTLSKLRQALGDDARSPRYVETIAKRGYRLLAEVEAIAAGAVSDDREDALPSAAPSGTVAAAPSRLRLWGWPSIALAVVVLLVVVVFVLPANFRSRTSYQRESAARVEDTAHLLTRADDAYFQFSRADNEAAIELYQRVLGLRPDDVAALSGLANALTQRSLRWPEPTGDGPSEFTQLRDALANGHLARPQAKQQLQRAQQLAERAVALAPESSAAHKALGFVASARGDVDAALVAYQRAVALDPDAWGALINIGDVLEIIGRDAEALPYFERAHAAMARGYARNPAQIRPWHARLGVVIAERHHARGDRAAAEGWYRKVLVQSPLHPEATRGLAALLREGGDAGGANRLCAELAQRLGAEQGCDVPAP